MPDTPTTLSIVAAVHNAASTFGDTLRCVYASDIPCDFDVVVVDDASTDSTPDLCRSFDLKLIELPENVGPARARNIAIRESRGGILLLLDSDVRFGADLIRKMLERMERDPEAAGVGSISAQRALNPGFYSDYFALQEWEYIASAIRRDPVTHRLGMCTRCGTLRRSVFEEAGGFDERFTDASIEDYDLSARILKRHRFIWDLSLENEHFFPETFGAICRRYRRNTRNVIALMGEAHVSRTSALRHDTRARLLVGMSAICLLSTLAYAPLLVASIAFLAGAIVTKVGLFSLLLERKGLFFCLGGIVVYVATSTCVGAGVVAGFWRRLRRS